MMGFAGETHPTCSTFHREVREGRLPRDWTIAVGIAALRWAEVMGLASETHPTCSPIRANGDGNQNSYLAAISDVLGNLLLAFLGMEPEKPFAKAYMVKDPEIGVDVLDDIHAVESDVSIPETQRLQLAKARVGQGLFRKRVMLIDPHCRVTGVAVPHLLIASHIKPWRHSTNAERIDGFNGIMLSPHVDALFDDHLLSFEDDGRMLVHSHLPADVLERWSIPQELKVDKFEREQIAYLEHHR